MLIPVTNTTYHYHSHTTTILTITLTTTLTTLTTSIDLGTVKGSSSEATLSLTRLHCGHSSYQTNQNIISYFTK